MDTLLSSPSYAMSSIERWSKVNFRHPPALFTWNLMFGKVLVWTIFLSKGPGPKREKGERVLTGALYLERGCNNHGYNPLATVKSLRSVGYLTRLTGRLLSLVAPSHPLSFLDLF